MKFCLERYIYIYKIKIIDCDNCKDRSKSYSENETIIFSYDELSDRC